MEGKTGTGGGEGDAKIVKSKDATTQFAGFLKGLKLEKYHKAIGEALVERAGMDMLLGMEEKDVKEMLVSAGVKPGHRARIVRALPEVKEERLEAERQRKQSASLTNCGTIFMEADQHHLVIPPLPQSPGLCSFAAWFCINPEMEAYRGYSNGCGAYLFSSNFFARDKNYGLAVFKKGRVSGVYVAQWGGPSQTLDSNVCDGKWHQIAQSDVDLFVDGKRVGSISNRLNEARGSLRVAFGPRGKVGYRSTRNGDISIKDFQLFTRRLTAEEINKNWEQGSGHMEKPLVHFPLNGDAKDRSGNGYHGSLFDKYNKPYLPNSHVETIPATVNTTEKLFGNK